MKKLLLFIIILCNSSALEACGFYPYGEDVRFQLLKPEAFGYQKYASFYYSDLSFNYENVYPEGESQPNELLWTSYCKNKVDKNDVKIVLEQFLSHDINENSSNSFIKYLYKTKNKEAINYLKFAKECEYFNTWTDDPWEKNENVANEKRAILIDNALKTSEKTGDKQIKERYCFLAIRLAFYNKDYQLLKNIYKYNFSATSQKNVIQIWALYFRALAEQDPALKNYYLAQVFKFSAEKRFACWQHFSQETSIESTLKFATNKFQEANVYEMYSVSVPDENIENLETIYSYNSKSNGLSFLLLREMMKMEDWFFTDYYTQFGSTDYEDISEGQDPAINMNENLEKERLYAQKLIDFINTVDLNAVQNPNLWKYCKAELLLITKQYTESLNVLSDLEKSVPKNDPVYSQVQQLKAINLIANQSQGKAIIPEEVKAIVLNNLQEKKFLFALGRELEYLGNFEDAAFFYASMEDLESADSFSGMYYKSRNIDKYSYSDYFYNYFDYVDYVYSPENLKKFLSKIDAVLKSKDEFYMKLHPFRNEEFKKLQDLLGVKYLRENNLNLAYQSFNKTGKDYYNVGNSLWERTDKLYDDSNSYLSVNPFYNLNFTPEFIPEKDQIALSKMSITKKLIQYLNKANDPAEKDRDYYYFLVANCYYNMSQFGNSWKMKRNNLHLEFSYTTIIDNKEFNTTGLAKYYYQKSFEQAKTPKFSALCLRMLGRCENNAFDFAHYLKDPYSYADDFYDVRLANNPYYQKLKTEFPDHYDDLMSNCDSFKSYFSARR